MPLLITTSFPPSYGGIQRYMAAVAEEFAAQNIPIVVLAPCADDAVAYDRTRPFAVHRFALGSKAFEILTMAVAIVRAAWGTWPAYTLASAWFPASAALLLPRRLRGAVGVFAHGSEIEPSHGGIRRWIVRRIFERADVVLANSSFTASLLSDLGVSRHVVVVPCGCEGREIVPNRAAAPTIVAVGRLIARKGFDRTIEALPAIAARVPEVVLDIIGDGPQRAQLERLARDAGVSERVRFHGSLSDKDLRAALARAWCFALPVRRIRDDVEGFGIVYLEAALAHLPVVAGRDSGAIDAVVDGETGILVDGGNAAEVAEAVLRLLTGDAIARSMGNAGFERATRVLTWSATAAVIHERLTACNAAGVAR